LIDWLVNITSFTINNAVIGH